MSLRRIFLHLKSIRYLAFIPPAVLDIVIPLLLYAFYREYGATDLFYGSVLEYTQLFLPFFSVWWVLFTLRGYVESDGNELLYVCKNRCRLPDCLRLFALFQLNVLLLFAVLALILPGILVEYVRILCICLLYFGLTYCTVFLTGGIVSAILLGMLYMLATAVFRSPNPNPILFLTADPISVALLLKISLPQALLGIALTAVGTVINLKYRRLK